MGTTEGEYSPKRRYVREKIKENCILKLACEDTGISEALFVETLNYSKGGLGIIYDGKKLTAGNKVSVYIENLNIIKKVAEVVWSKQINGDYAAGFQWA